MRATLSLLLLFVTTAFAVCPWQDGGLTRWSNGNQNFRNRIVLIVLVPGWNVFNATVVVPAGTRVLLDTSVTLASLNISGEVVLNNAVFFSLPT